MDSKASGDDRPTKRQRVDDQSASAAETGLSQSSTKSPNIGRPSISPIEQQAQKERSAGITEYVHRQSKGFTGVLKQRYTDFQVNEVAEDGAVIHLHTLRAPKRGTQEESSEKNVARNGSDEAKKKEADAAKVQKPAEELQKVATEDATTTELELSEDDRATLQELFGEAMIPNMLRLHAEILKHPERKPRDFRHLLSAPIENKEDRTKAHQACRKVFNGKLETQTASDNCIRVMPAPRNAKPRGGDFEKNGVKQRGKVGWDELGGDYLHFTIYKENKDTMEVISFLASQLKVNNKSFQFGGTKDRRAVTAQRCSAYRIRAEQMLQAGRRLNGPTRVGDYKYQPKGISLGEIGGNEFTIGLRDCHFPGEDGLDFKARLALAQDVLDDAVTKFKDDGFVNYFGLQRFGTFANSTDTVGTKMLQGDLQGAVEDILQFSPDALVAALEPEKSTIQVSSDDKARAQAIDMFKKTGEATKALEILPRKFSAESNIIRYLGQKDRKTNQFPRRNDYQGALQGIPRALRLMYVHAYQSLVFNVVAGERLKLYGLAPVEGDLIIVPAGSNSAFQPGSNEEVDEQGEVIVRPAADDSATTEDSFERARPLTAQEAASGRYSIFDIVLPLPGFDIIYPANKSGEVYKTFMASERGGKLDPYDMRRSWKDISLSGGYRKFLARPGADMSFQIKPYANDEEQLIETDLQRLQQREEDPSQKKQDAWRKENGYDQPEPAKTQDEAPSKIAVILKMRLGSSQYATMALRELMGEGGVTTYKPDYGGGR